MQSKKQCENLETPIRQKLIKKDSKNKINIILRNMNKERMKLVPHPIAHSYVNVNQPLTRKPFEKLKHVLFWFALDARAQWNCW